jgi:membrane protein DedA with SNARE-associated domain
MGGISQAITGFLQHNNNPLGLLLLGVSALLEYVFPPFPGDTVTLFGAFLVTRYEWSVAKVFVAVLAGSGIGAMIDFAFGVWVGRRYSEGRILKSPAVRNRIDRVLDAFRRHGEVYVVLNRFLPAVRAVFFVAAGMARLRAWRVLVFALLSAALWNALIIGAGYSVGSNWNRITEIFRTYSIVAWGLIAAVVAGLALRFWLRRRRQAGSGKDPTAR